MPITVTARNLETSLWVDQQYRLDRISGKPNYGGQFMALASAFETAKNLGSLTEAWLRHVREALRKVAPDLGYKIDVASSASAVAPAALIATIARQAEGDWRQRPFRVMLLGTDPLIRLDRSAWSAMAGELLGIPGCIEVVLALDEAADSQLAKLAEALQLPPCHHLPHEQARAHAIEEIDLAIWVHPAVEAMNDHETENTATALALADAGVPVYTASFNETDIAVQDILLNTTGWRLQPLGGEIKRGSPAVNRFAISTAQLGVEGGWAAILCRLEWAEQTYTPHDQAVVRAAMRIVCLEGAVQGGWSLGQHLNGVAFNRIIPVGLIGNLAVDPQTGHLFSQDGQTKELRLVGQVWSSKLSSMPVARKDLLVWACEVKLAFLATLPKETGRRQDSILSLEEAAASGVTAAGVGLARYYEALGSAEALARSKLLYQGVADQHPLSAYSLAYDAIHNDDLAAAERHLRVAAESGYPVAMTDLGKLLYSQGRTVEAVDLLVRAAALKEPEANYELGELSAKAGQLQKALDYLRAAWAYGHSEAAGLAAEIAAHMLQCGVGKRSLIKRELREIEAFRSKLKLRSEASHRTPPDAS